MADFDPDAYLKNIKSKAPPAADDSWTGEAVGAVKDFGKGVAKGVGNLAEELPTLGTPHVSELDPNAKQFLQSPNETWSESIGEFAGETAPTMIGGPEAGLGKLATRGLLRVAPRGVARVAGDVAGRSAAGAAGGAAQPVKPGESRLANTLTGAVTGGVLAPRVLGPVAGLAGGATAGMGVEELIRRFGYYPVAGALAALGLGGFHHYGLQGLAKAARAARKPGEWIGGATPSGLAGGAAGAAAEKGQENRDQ